MMLLYPLRSVVQVHLGDDVCCAVYIVPRHLAEQSALLLQTFVKPRAGRGLKQANHRRHNPASLNEINLPLEDGGCVIVKTNDKASQHLQAGSLEAFHIFHQVTVQVLLFAAFSQTILIRRLDPDKDSTKSRFDHHLH